MVTLVVLGLVERGRMGRGDDAPHAFRLTRALALAAFGSLDIAPPLPPRAMPVSWWSSPTSTSWPTSTRPTPPRPGCLGRMAESDSTHSGPVRTFRLTQSSVYRAEEGGLGHDQIVAFLKRAHAQGDAPAQRRAVDRRLDRQAREPGAAVRALPCSASPPRPPATPTSRPIPTARPAASGSRSRRGLRGKRRPVCAGALASVSHLRRGAGGRPEPGRTRQHQGRSADRHRPVFPAPPDRPSALDPDGLAAQRPYSIGRASAAGLKRAQVHRWLSDHLAHARSRR